MNISLPRDNNRIVVAGGVYDDASGTIAAFPINSSNGRLKISATIASGGGGITSINTDTTAAQIIAAGTGLTVTDNGTGTHTISFTTTTGSGAVVLANSPALITPALGAATATSLSASGIIATGANSGTNGSITFNGSTSGSTVLQANAAAGGTLTLPTTSGTLALTSQLTSGTVTAVSVASANGFTGTSSGGATPALTIATSITGILQGNGTAISAASTTGSGSIVLANSPALITPALGAATATTINGNTFTTGTYTLTGTAAKTLTFSNSLTLAGTDGTTMTFPSTSATIARTDAAQTFTGIQTIPQVVNTPLAASVSSNAATITRASRINNFTNSSAATMAITLSTSGALDGDMLVVRIYDFSAVAETIGWTNTENSTITVPTTSNGSTTLPLTVGFIYNVATSKWRCIASA